MRQPHKHCSCVLRWLVVSLLLLIASVMLQSCEAAKATASTAGAASARSVQKASGNRQLLGTGLRRRRSPSATCAIGSSLRYQKEHNALLEFYAAAGGSGWAGSAYTIPWGNSSNASHCDWSGVT